MPENRNGLPHYVQANPMAVAGSTGRTGKQIKESRHLVTGNAYTGVVDFDTDGVPGGTAADENATSGICIFDGVTHQIS
jgi:hypothetical protein